MSEFGSIFWANSSMTATAPPAGATTAAALVPKYAGLTSAQELARRQAAADREFADRARRSSLAGLTIRTALEDVREVLVGVPADLFGASSSEGDGGALPLAHLLAKNDRLRGLGLLCLAASLLAVALL